MQGLPIDMGGNASSTAPRAVLMRAFDATASSDPDGSVASYSWDFGDGSAPCSGATPQHTYASGGTYQVTLTMTDNQGATGTVEHDVTVTPPPNQPPVRLYVVGQRAHGEFRRVGVVGSGRVDRVVLVRLRRRVGGRFARLIAAPAVSWLPRVVRGPCSSAAASDGRVAT